jgi:hypothetical protein
VEASSAAAVRLRLSSFRRLRTHLSFTLKDGHYRDYNTQPEP